MAPAAAPPTPWPSAWFLACRSRLQRGAPAACQTCRARAAGGGWCPWGGEAWQRYRVGGPKLATEAGGPLLGFGQALGTAPPAGSRSPAGPPAFSRCTRRAPRRREGATAWSGQPLPPHHAAAGRPCVGAVMPLALKRRNF